jgi:hypothetical protein
MPKIGVAFLFTHIDLKHEKDVSTNTLQFCLKLIKRSNSQVKSSGPHLLIVLFRSILTELWSVNCLIWLAKI